MNVAKTAILFLILMLVPVIPSHAASMKQLPGDHFIVFYENDENIARQVLHQSERHYSSILRRLGHDSLEQPWLSDRRCKIKIYRDKTSFTPNVQNVGWAEGMTNFAAREIYLYENAAGLFTSTLPHELAHMIFRDIVGFSPNIPLWLDEGVALSQEAERRESFYPFAREAFDNGTHMPFVEMSKMRSATDLNDAQANIFYAQSTVTVNYLIDTFHEKKFVKFCSHLKDGMTVEEALRRVYATDRIGTLKDLEDKVRQSLQ